MDLNKLTTGEKLTCVSAIVLLIASFLPWFEFPVPFIGGRVTANGWDVGFGWAGIPVILGLAMLVQILINRLSPGLKLPRMPVSWGQVHLIAGVVAAFIVVLKLLVGEDPSELVDRSYGLFLAALAAVALAVGGFRIFKESQGASSTTTW